METETKQRKPSKADYLDERVHNLRGKLKLAKYTELMREVSLPVELAAALMTGRPELARLAPKRDFTQKEAQELYNAVVVLIETNRALQEHAQELGLLVNNWAAAFTQLRSTGAQIERFAKFQTLDETSAEQED